MALIQYKNLVRRWLLILTVFAVGLISGWLSQDFRNAQLKTPAAHVIREPQTQYKFIDPLLAVGDLPTQRAYKSLENDLASYITQTQQ